MVKIVRMECLGHEQCDKKPKCFIEYAVENDDIEEHIINGFCFFNGVANVEYQTYSIYQKNELESKDNKSRFY